MPTRPEPAISFAGPSPAIPCGMRPPLSQIKTNTSGRISTLSRKTLLAVLLLQLPLCFLPLGCGGGSTGLSTPPPTPPPPEVSVSVTPTSAAVLLGNSQTLTATVTNTTNNSVTWSVNGVPGGASATGTITSGGTYTAPADLPASAIVQVTATSEADTTKSATALLTITSDIAIALAPPNANVELGAKQPFRATISSAGHPDTSVRWSITGAACPAACGSVDLNGNYTAPAILPSAATATITAQSVADPSKQSSAPINITSDFTLLVTAPASVPAGATATIVATMTPLPGSNPSTVLTWSLSGPGCSSAACGTLTVVTTQGVGGNATADTATYTAPTAPPNPASVTVTPQADPTKKAQATMAVQAGVNVGISPPTDTLAANHRVTLTAQVFGTTNTGVNWSVSGIPGGNAALGQICVVGSNPCQSVTSASALQVDYVAPGSIPQPNPVSVMATSVADATKSASAQITLINHVLVSVQPQSVTLSPLAVQAFAATVLGTNNQTVVWQIQGTACTNSGVCGAIDALGNYTAPGSAPSPDALQVVAISSDDTTQSGAANVTISTGSSILSLHPASVYAGAADGFTVLVEGSGFTPSSPGPGSSVLVGGTARTTTCIAATECTAPVTAADVSIAGAVSIQIQNPNGTESNAVSLVVAPPNVSEDVIALSSASPASTGKDITVVDPTTAGISAQGNDVDLNVAALGMFSTATNACSLTGNPMPLPRPASGSTTYDICVFSESGLDTSMTYTVTGPGDVTVITKQPAGLGIIHLTLQIPASALPGARTLFIQNTNLDETAASGALEIQ